MEDVIRTSIGLLTRTQARRLATTFVGNASPGASGRHDRRWTYEPVILDLVLEGEVSSRVSVPCRNISRSGVAVLHSAYLQQELPVQVMLGDRFGKEHAVGGRVVRSGHVSGVIHEVGIEFDEPIHLEDFVRIDRLSEQFTIESPRPADLEGRILVIGDSEVEHRLIRHYLRQTRLDVEYVTDSGDGYQRAHEDFVLILCDFDMPGMSGGQLVTMLRDEGVQTPVLVVSADVSEDVRDLVRQSRASGFVRKPFAQHALLGAIADLLTFGQSTSTSGPVFADVPADMLPLATDYASELNEISQRLRAAFESQDASAFERLAVQIADTAPSMGFRPIGAAAVQVVQVLKATDSILESCVSAHSLISMCERATAA